MSDVEIQECSLTFTMNGLLLVEMFRFRHDVACNMLCVHNCAIEIHVYFYFYVFRPHQPLWGYQCQWVGWSTTLIQPEIHHQLLDGLP